MKPLSSNTREISFRIDLCSMQNREIFKKRPGTTDKGKDYENFMVAKLVLEFATNNNIEDFNVWSNDEQFGAFDDVILEVEEKNQNIKKCALQLKHVNQKGKQLSLKSLAEENGNFSIKKYFRSFQQCKKFISDFNLILLTNLKFSLHKTIDIQLGNQEKFHVRIIKCDVDIKFNVGVAECYKFKIVDDINSSKLVEYENFFESFFLYTNQMHVDDLKSSIYEKMKQTFSCDNNVADKLLKFVTEWSLREGTKNKLDKEMVEQILTLNLLRPFIIPISFGEITENGKLLQTAISKFHVSTFHLDLIEDVTLLWGDSKDDVENKELQTINKNYQITAANNFDKNNLSNSDWSKVLWIMGKSPLLVRECPIFYEAIRLCRNKIFVLIGRNVDISKEFSAFQKLSDLKCHHEVFKNLIANFVCSFSRNKISLEELLCHNEELQDVISTNVLLTMVNQPYTLTPELEDTPVPYISRILTKNVINLAYLEDLHTDTLLLISNVTTEQDFNLLKNFQPVDLDERPEANFDVSTDPERNIYISRKTLSRKEFTLFCEKNGTRKTFHHFKMSDGCLEWFQSTGSSDILSLQQHKKDDCFIEETNLWSHNFENNIHLIVGDPGIGKSCLLKCMKNNFSRNIWTTILLADDITKICSFFQRSNKYDELHNFIINLKYPNYTQFDKYILIDLINSKQIVYFWDALDEIVTEENINIIGNVINYFSSRHIVQWVTCRSNLKSMLEKKFKVLARSIIQFSDEQQIDYIRERLKSVCINQQNASEITMKIKNNVAFVKHKDILSIPLQIYMLTELCRQDLDKYSNLLKELFSVADIYQYFVEEKFNFYYKDKIKIDDSHSNQLKKTQKNHIRHFEQAALHVILEQKILEELNVDCGDFLEDTEFEGDCFGFVTEITGNVNKRAIKFAHISYAEYFVASYFARRKVPKLKDILFRERYMNVRYFFDLLLAKDSPAHIAVLYGNTQEVENSEYCKDIGGRNMLQLACSWSKKYPLLNFEKVDDIYVLDETSFYTKDVKIESSEYLQMLEGLVDKCDIYETDNTFNMNTIQYAEISGCLLSLAVIEEKLKTNYFSSKDDSFNCSLLYYIVMFGLDKFVPLFQKYLKFVRIEDNKTLLHLAYTSGNEKIVKFLLNAGLDVNATNKHGHTSLHMASLNEQDKMSELLIKFGAKINAVENNGMSPLHFASLAGYVKSANLLIKFGSDINAAASSTGYTPLHLASSLSYDGVVDLLIKLGADINAISKGSFTALHAACRNGCFTVAETLIKLGADLKATTEDGWTPLHHSCYKGHYEVVEMLVQLGVDIDNTTIHGWTPLHLACDNGHIGIVHLLLRCGANVQVFNSKGRTPLHLAAQRGFDKVVKLLMESGADIDVFDKLGFTPFHLAAGQGLKNVIHLLLSFKTDINANRGDNWTPLHLACLGQHDAIADVANKMNAFFKAANDGVQGPLNFSVSTDDELTAEELLLQFGTDINIASNYGYLTHLQPILTGENNIVNMLLEAGVNVNAANKRGWTSLHVCSENGHLYFAESLVKYGADINAANDYGWTPLHSAVLKGHERIVNFLINSGANINSITNTGATALYLACLQGYVEIVNLLINFGAEIDGGNEYNTTPLTIACCWGHKNVAQLLLEAGANVNNTDKNGVTPYVAALHNKHGEIVDLLKEHSGHQTTSFSTPLYASCEVANFQAVEAFLQMGANVETLVYNDWRPIHVACFKGNERIVTKLLAAGASVNVHTSAGDSPGELAREFGNRSIFEIISEYKNRSE